MSQRDRDTIKVVALLFLAVVVVVLSQFAIEESRSKQVTSEWYLASAPLVVDQQTGQVSVKCTWKDKHSRNSVVREIPVPEGKDRRDVPCGDPGVKVITSS